MIAIRTRSNFSIQRAFADISDLIERAVELGMSGIVLADVHSMSGHVEFLNTISKINKKKNINFKGILSVDFRVQHDGKEYLIQVVARNKNGWYNLIEIIGLSKLEDSISGDPYIKLQDLYDKISSENCFIIYNDSNVQFANLDKSNVKLYNGNSEIDDVTKIHGQIVLYVNKDDAKLLRIITSSRLKCTIKDVDVIEKDYEAHNYVFHNDDFYLRSDTDPDNTSETLHNLCENYSLSSQPNIPKFINNGKPIEDVDEYLTELCREGWKKYNLTQNKHKDVYLNRIKYELDVIKTFKLSNYFLIIWDIANFVRSKGYPCGLRGSAVGCLISYLIGISKVDPVCPDPCQPYDHNKELLFSRFLNKGRLAKGNVSLPDIDLDVPIGMRHTIIQYIKDKYGHDCVGHIITFSRMDGKMAIKEVFAVLDKYPKVYELTNYICSYMIETDKVQDELEILKEDDPKYNIINYCIDNIPKIAEFAKEYEEEFNLAIKLSNCIKNSGKHAAGIVIASQPLSTLFPISLDKKTNEFVVALEMADAESVGAVKYDILGVAAYDKMYSIDEMIENELLEPNIVGDVENEDI